MPHFSSFAPIPSRCCRVRRRSAPAISPRPFLIIQELRKGGSEKAELFSKRLLIGIAAAVVYFVLLKILGFVLDSIWVVFVMMALLLNEPFKKA